jgi:hypothetical protein
MQVDLIWISINWFCFLGPIEDVICHIPKRNAHLLPFFWPLASIQCVGTEKAIRIKWRTCNRLSLRGYAEPHDDHHGGQYYQRTLVGFDNEDRYRRSTCPQYLREWGTIVLVEFGYNEFRLDSCHSSYSFLIIPCDTRGLLLLGAYTLIFAICRNDLKVLEPQICQSSIDSRRVEPEKWLTIKVY